MKSHHSSHHSRRAISQRLPAFAVATLLVSSLAAVTLAGDSKNESSVARPAFPADASLARIDDASDATSRETLGSLRGERATVVAFLAPTCPISNAYVPTLNRVADELAGRGGRLIGVYVDGPAKTAEIREHRREFAIEFATLRDERNSLARALGVTRVPGVCVFDAAGGLVYRGRIDDRYARRGGAANKVLDASLRDALAAALAGKADFRETEIVGCPISFPSADEESPETKSHDASSSNSEKLTYAEHVAPILAERCQQCHRPGGVGPFSLTTYEDAVHWADDVKRFTQDRTMPPWKPLPGHGEFRNSRRMSDEEIRAIAAWVDAGTPLGDASRIPAPREFPDGWRLGEPDLILEPSESFTLAAEGEDEYRCFVLPTNFTQNRFVAALEVRPGNGAVVHHVLTFVDSSGTARRLDAADPAPGYRTSQGFPGFLPAGALGGWAPGNTRGFLPDGMARVLPPGADVVMQVHYHRSGKPETDRTRLGVHFAKGPVDRAVGNLIVAPLRGPFGGLRIPAGESAHEVRVDVPVTRDLLAVSITPHMHLLGKDMRVAARLPSGERVPLVHLTDWDFNWQETYQFVEPVPLPKGTTIELTAHYDNSAENPRNPSRPPRLVVWGEQTTDEMCVAFIEAAPQARAASPADLQPERPGRQLVDRLRHAAGEALDDWRGALLGGANE